MPGIPLSIEHTLDFVLENLGASPARILDIGAGAGGLAAALAGRGHRVTALDEADPADGVGPVAQPAGAALETIRGSWPGAGAGLGPFDAVVFCRSLHHMHELDASVEAALAALGPSGRLVVEDFDIVTADPATAGWAAGRARAWTEAGRLQEADDGFAMELARAADPLEAWRARWDHAHVHGLALMRQALDRGGAVRLSEARGPYLFRFFEAAVADPAGQAEAVRRLKAAEEAAIEAGEIRPIGWRVVAGVAGRDGRGGRGS